MYTALEKITTGACPNLETKYLRKTAKDAGFDKRIIDQLNHSNLCLLLAQTRERKYVRDMDKEGVENFCKGKSREQVEALADEAKIEFDDETSTKRICRDLFLRAEFGKEFQEVNSNSFNLRRQMDEQNSVLFEQWKPYLINSEIDAQEKKMKDQIQQQAIQLKNKRKGEIGREIGRETGKEIGRETESEKEETTQPQPQKKRRLTDKEEKDVKTSVSMSIFLSQQQQQQQEEKEMDIKDTITRQEQQQQQQQLKLSKVEQIAQTFLVPFRIGKEKQIFYGNPVTMSRFTRFFSDPSILDTIAKITLENRSVSVKIKQQQQQQQQQQQIRYIQLLPQLELATNKEAFEFVWLYINGALDEEDNDSLKAMLFDAQAYIPKTFLQLMRVFLCCEEFGVLFDINSMTILNRAFKECKRTDHPDFWSLDYREKVTQDLVKYKQFLALSGLRDGESDSPLYQLLEREVRRRPKIILRFLAEKGGAMNIIYDNETGGTYAIRQKAEAIRLLQNVGVDKQEIMRLSERKDIHPDSIVKRIRSQLSFIKSREQFPAAHRRYLEQKQEEQKRQKDLLLSVRMLTLEEKKLQKENKKSEQEIEHKRQEDKRRQELLAYLRNKERTHNITSEESTLLEHLEGEEHVKEEHKRHTDSERDNLETLFAWMWKRKRGQYLSRMKKRQLRGYINAELNRMKKTFQIQERVEENLTEEQKEQAQLQREVKREKQKLEHSTLEGLVYEKMSISQMNRFRELEPIIKRDQIHEWLMPRYRKMILKQQQLQQQQLAQQQQQQQGQQQGQLVQQQGQQGQLVEGQLVQPQQAEENEQEDEQEEEDEESANEGGSQSEAEENEGEQQPQQQQPQQQAEEGEQEEGGSQSEAEGSADEG